MRYDVCGGFEFSRKANRTGDYEGKPFWKMVDDEVDGLSGACGCYIFALKNGDNLKAWYVGKAEKLTFAQECFSPAKRLIFNDVLLERNGTPLLFLLPRLTPNGKLSKPTRNAYDDIEFLETMLIGVAIEENPELTNLQKTKYLREMRVPGVINSPQARPTRAVADLRNALGLLRS